MSEVKVELVTIRATLSEMDRAVEKHQAASRDPLPEALNDFVKAYIRVGELLRDPHPGLIT